MASKKEVKEYREAAKELKEKLKLEPEEGEQDIDLEKASGKELIEFIRGAGPMIEPTDEISDATKEVVLKLSGAKDEEQAPAAVAVEKKPKKEKPNIPPRINVMFDAIGTTPQTAEEIAEKANKNFIAMGGKDNVKQTLHILKATQSLLVHTGVLVVNEEGKLSKKS